MQIISVFPPQSPPSKAGSPSHETGTVQNAAQNRPQFHIKNRATLIGFLGKDAELKTTRNNTWFTVLSVATKRSWKDRESGEYKSQTTWHRCTVFGKLCDYAATLTKGAHVQIEGEIRTREYAAKSAGKTAAEVTKSITEVRVTSITKLDRPAKSESPAEGAAA